MFPEKLSVDPPVPGIGHLYFMGGKIRFEEQHRSLLVWDDSDVLVYRYGEGGTYSYHGPLFARISSAQLDATGAILEVTGWDKDQAFEKRVALGSLACPAGLGHLSDGVFVSTPASEHPNRRISRSTGRGLRHLLARIFNGAA